MAEATNCWIGVPLSRKYNHHLFMRRDDNGSIIIPEDQSTECIDMVELVLLNECTVYTSVQRTADWFLCKFRITATLGAFILKRDLEIRKFLKLVTPLDTLMMEEELISLGCEHWFGHKRSTDAML